MTSWRQGPLQTTDQSLDQGPSDQPAVELLDLVSALDDRQIVAHDAAR